MTPAEFRAIRIKLGLSCKQWATELGYGHKANNIRLMQNYESGKKELPPWTARLAYLIFEHFTVESGHLPEWPAHWKTKVEEVHE